MKFNVNLSFQCDCQSKKRRRSVTCTRLGKLVNDRECLQEPKPDESIGCYDECLMPQWQIQAWQPVCMKISFFKIRQLSIIY